MHKTSLKEFLESLRLKTSLSYQSEFKLVIKVKKTFLHDLENF